jgi:hypothetical protein
VSGTDRDRIEVQGRAGEAAALGPHRAERAGQVHAGDRDLAQRPGGQFGRDGQRAEHGRGGPGRDRGLDRGGGRQLGGRGHALQAGLGAQRLLQVAPGTRPGLAADQRGSRELGGRDAAAAPGPGVGRADDEGERVPADRFGVQAIRDAGALDEADVGGVGQHGLRDLGGVDRGQRHDSAGVDRPQRGQPRRQQVLRHGHAGRDAQPGVALSAQCGQAGVQRLRGVDRGLRPARHQRAGRGQLRAARGALDQRQAELSLKQPHPGAGGGLRDAVLGRRAPDAAGARHGQEQVEAGQVGHPRRQRHK